MDESLSFNFGENISIFFISKKYFYYNDFFANCFSWTPLFAFVRHGTFLRLFFRSSNDAQQKENGRKESQKYAKNGQM